MSVFSYAYAVTFLVAILLLFIYLKKFKNQLDKDGLVIFVAVILINLGYFILSWAKSLDLALFANRLAYFGNIVLLVEVYFVINKFCNIKNRRSISVIIYLFSFLIFLLVCTGGSKIGWYYQSVDININNNLTKLVKEYGPLHFLYSVYVFAIFGITLATTIWAIKKKQIINNISPYVLLLIVMENIFVWFVERLANVEMELLTISYIITEAIFLLFLETIWNMRIFLSMPKRLKKSLKIGRRPIN